MTEDDLIAWSNVLGKIHSKENELELFYMNAKILETYEKYKPCVASVAYYYALDLINKRDNLTKEWILEILKELKWNKARNEIQQLISTQNCKIEQIGNENKELKNNVVSKENIKKLKWGKTVIDLAQLTISDKDWNVPNKDKDFVGRRNKLEKLDALIKMGNETVITACVGLGGIGKTLLTVEYVRTNKDKYNKVVWFKAELSDSLKEEFLLFGYEMGFTKKENKDIQPILTWFVRNPGWLIVFDNVETPESIQNYIPHSGGKILITTRNGSLFETANKIELDIYTLEEVSDYLQRKLPRQYEEANSKNLISEFANELNYHPLALTQAVSYMRETKRSVKWYLDEKEKQKCLHAKNIEKSQDQLFLQYYSCVLDSLMISIKRFLGDDKTMDYLQIIAFLAPEKIPRILFDEAILISLDKYSVIKLDDDLFFSIHRLVQESIRFILAGKSNDEDFKRYFSNILFAELDKAYDFINFSYPFGKVSKEDLVLKSYLLPHFVAILNYYPLNLTKEEKLSLAKTEIKEVPQIVDETQSPPISPLTTEVWNKNPVVDAKINFQNALMQDEDIDKKILILTVI